jgi:hypothetical protein
VDRRGPGKFRGCSWFGVLRLRSPGLRVLSWRMRASAPVTMFVCSVLVGCGEDPGTSASASGTATTVTTAGPTGDPSSGGTQAPTTGEAGTGGSGSDSVSDATSDVTSEATSSPTSGDDTGLKLDVGSPDGQVACGCEFSYVWVANAEQGTVSKINMDTLVEEGRYWTRADHMGNPSRTSVSLGGDVAVANRHGGLVKFYADKANCKESNGVPGIQTSSGKDDILEWNMEECRAWYLDFPTSNQRPVAWTQGTIVPGTCATSNEKVWTVMSENKGLFPGLGAPGGVIVALVDGDTGKVDKQITIPTFSGDSFGAYGGAVNVHGDLFFTSMAFNGGKLGQVYIDNLAYKVHAVPPEIGPYGITVDHKGQVWLSSVALGGNGVARFDPEILKWDVVPGFWGGAGLAEGPDDWMWVSSTNGVNAVHIDTLALGKVFKSQYTIKGVGFDDKGFMWAVNWSDVDDANQPVDPELVLKVDIDTLSVVGSYDGLDRPYTYSDFTGNALFNVSCLPPL